MTNNLYVRSITYYGENRKDRRKLKIKLNTGRVITAIACQESWEQWEGNRNELCYTIDVVEAHNDWLHGGPRPYYGISDD